MAFRIKSGESFSRAVRRLARAQLRGAADALGDRGQPLPERVHEVRTSIKKVRALAELARPVVGRRARRADRRLHHVGAALSALRDADVLPATFDALLPAVPSEAERAALRQARDRLAARLRAAARPLEAEDQLDEVEARLRRARRRTSRWVPRSGDGGGAGRSAGRGGWRALCVGIVRGYRRARRSMKRAYGDRSGDSFHRWRKAVKTHRYQLQLLEDVWPERSASHFDDLERLGELLGEEHDLTVLAETARSDQASFPSEPERTALLALIERRRRALRSEARVLGARLFDERPRAFRRRIRKDLRAAPRAEARPRPSARSGSALPHGHRRRAATRPPRQPDARPAGPAELRAV